MMATEMDPELRFQQKFDDNSFIMSFHSLLKFCFPLSHIEVEVKKLSVHGTVICGPPSEKLMLKFQHLQLEDE